jgi:Uma2 family endonuclease
LEWGVRVWESGGIGSRIGLEAGTRMVWVVYPRTRTVTVYRSLKDVQVLRADETLSGEDVLPGFERRVGEIFE